MKQARTAIIGTIRMHEALAASFANDRSPANASRSAAHRAIAQTLRAQAGLDTPAEAAPPL